MRKLTNIELEEISYIDNIMYEEVIRLERKTQITKAERVNNIFASVSSELVSYSVTKDEKIRDVFNTAYSWKNENPELVKEVISSYCPIKMSNTDISKLVDTAISI